MRSNSRALLVLLTLLGVAPADAASDVDVVRRFGILGKMAVDCAAPAGSSNPHLFFAVSPQGKVTRTLTMDPKLDATLAMRNLRLLAPDRMQYDETGRQSELTITMVKINGKFRSWRSVRADGTVLIADGKFASSGNPTMVFTSCRN